MIYFAITMMTLLPTFDEGHHRNVNVMKMGFLVILLLVFRTSRILTKTALRLNLFLNLCHNFFSIWETLSILDGYRSLVLQYKHIPIYIPVGETSILKYCNVKHNFGISWVGEFWKNLSKDLLWQNVYNN